MVTSTMRVFAAVAGAVATAAVGLSPATAAVAEGEPLAHPVAATAAEQQAIRDYWTPERIAAMPTGPDAGKPPVDGPDGSAWYGGDGVAKTVGRLFYTERGEDASCTATIVASAKGDVAVTGGHCVHTFNLIREDPQWAANLLFVPGFADGEMPYGSFVPRWAVADRNWVEDDEKDEYDQAFLVLNPATDGRQAAEVTGAAQKIGYGVPGAGTVTQLGYPRAAKLEGHQGRPEFTGQRVAQCFGDARENPGTPSFPEPKGMFGLNCDMGGGSSGGPRLASFDGESGLGTVVGVNTQGYYLDADGKGCDIAGDLTDCTRQLGGPQFSESITHPLFTAAETS